MLRRLALPLLALGLLAAPAAAQQRASTFRSLTAPSACVVLESGGMGTGVWDVRGSFSGGTVSFTISANGTDFAAIDVAAPDTPSTFVNGATSAGVWGGSVAGYRYMRACTDGAWSGSVVVTLSAAATGGGGGGGSGGGGTGDGVILDGSSAGQADVITTATDGTEEGLVVRCASGCSTPTSFDLDTGAGSEVVAGASLRIGASGGSIPITAGAGAVDAGTIRFTLASDDLAVAALERLDNAVSGNEFQVDLVAALPAGTNNIGDVDVLTLPSVTVGTFPDNEPFNMAQLAGTTVSTGNGTVDAGTIRVNLTSNGTGVVGVTQSTASNLNAQVVGAVAHDAAAAGNPVQIAGFAASSAPANVTGNDVSRIWTSLFGAVNVILRDTAGAAVSAGGIAQADESAFTPGTTSFTPIGGQVDDTATDSLDEGEAGAARLTTYRALHVNLRDSADNELVAAQDASHDEAASATGPQIVGEFDDTSPDAVDEGDAGRLRISANRNLYTTIRDGANNERGLAVDVNGRIGITGSGTFAAQIDGAALTALQLIDDSIFADDAAFTIGTSKVNMAGFTVDESSTDSADEGDAVAARTTPDRVQWAANAAVSATSQGASTHYVAVAATTNSTNVKNAAGNVYGLRFVNTTATVYYLRMYNTSSAPTCSSATGFVESVPIPSFSATDGDGAGIVAFSGIPQAYTTGISYCITANAASNDNNAAATGVYGTILYKAFDMPRFGYVADMVLHDGGL